jgi:hypothetical protein
VTEGRARRLCAVAALAAVVASPAAGAASARPASTQTDFKVLHIATDAWGFQLTPPVVGAAQYTVQVHNIYAYTVHVTIGKLVDVIVKPDGWVFRDATFRPHATYPVHAVAPQVKLSWDAVLTSQ